MSDRIRLDGPSATVEWHRQASNSGIGDSRVEKLLYAIQLGQGIGTLRFVPALEAEFRSDHAERYVQRLRIGFMVAIGLYLTFLILRLLNESGPAASWGLAIRSIIIGTMLATILVSYTALVRHLTPIVVFTYFVFGAGVTSIECIAEYFHIDRRYEGLIFISIHCYVFSGLLFRWACSTTLMIFLTYAIGGWLGGLTGKEWGYELFFLLLINVLGAVALYLLEYSDRENFLRRHIIREMAIRDSLTGLFNRAAFVDHVERALRQAARESEPAALMIVDLDHFKQYNDQYGHLAGDECLRRVAEAMGTTARRPLDMLARYGGEEFIGFWYSVSTEDLPLLAERLRESVAELNIPHVASALTKVTISVGAVAVEPHHGEKLEALIRLADEALYMAKAAGRNRVSVQYSARERERVAAS